MTLIKSISGIRGTIGGNTGQNLTPIDIVESISAYGSWLKTNHINKKLKVVIGRDARISGEMVENICIGTLQAMGINVVNIGLSTTPTVEIAVPLENADGGIILTASHNPKQWNALKLLNNKGEFISADDGKQLLSFVEKNQFSFASVEELGLVTFKDNYIDEHINKILKLNHVDVNVIKEAELSVVIDGVNSTGGIVIPELLKALHCKEITEIYCTPNGEFPHNPEPLAEHLVDLSDKVKEKNADLGIVVDPDVDRLAFVCENGEVFGEEYTLVAVADHITGETPGNSVSNLSSTRALADVTIKNGGKYYASAVGEVNVVEMMKEKNAVIGGEGNGGVIFPELHYGRDALVGIALFLTYLAKKKLKMSDLKSSFPQYTISKNKLALNNTTNIDLLLKKISNKYKTIKQNKIDGLKLEFEKEWVHMRKSNTEPIIRIYAESQNQKSAHNLGVRFVEELKSLI
ncbi:MAG: phosphoglucosamine mutase [Crocinitomicaceae bacterium]|nr:phosphoglucosamine mutase [Crocinitomicaceae bacterium]